MSGDRIWIWFADNGNIRKWQREPFPEGTEFLAVASPAGWRPPVGNVEIAHDGFVGDIIGHYVTREGKRGVVVQQDGTRVVHVYGEKWLVPQEAERCPICAVPFKAGDTCGSDIEMGTCHAECLEGSPTVELDTGEPVDGPIPTYRYDEVSKP